VDTVDWEEIRGDDKDSDVEVGMVTGHAGDRSVGWTHVL
jgi:hypothetical protein